MEREIQDSLSPAELAGGGGTQAIARHRRAPGGLCWWLKGIAQRCKGQGGPSTEVTWCRVPAASILRCSGAGGNRAENPNPKPPHGEKFRQKPPEELPQSLRCLPPPSAPRGLSDNKTRCSSNSLRFWEGIRDRLKLKRNRPKADALDAPSPDPTRGVSQHPQRGALSEGRKRNLLGCFPSPIFIQRNEKRKKKKNQPKNTKTQTKPTFTEQTSENKNPNVFTLQTAPAPRCSQTQLL